jgi:plasmid stability protein
MATVQIRNLDDQAYDVLRARAAESGRSLQEYVRLLLEEAARKESITSALTRMRLDVAWSESTVTMADIVELQRAGRDR